MNIEDYEGKRVKLGKTPRTMMPHNAVTFAKLKAAIDNSNGVATFEHLVALSKDHEHGTEGKTHPYQFVTYCLKSGWLELLELKVV